VHIAEEAVVRVAQVPRDLPHPVTVRLTCDASDFHGPGLELHDEEDDVADQSGHGQHLDGEEVGGCEAVPMRGEERLPGRLRAALRCWLNAVIREDRFDRVARDVVAEARQPAADARVAPGRVSIAMRTTIAAISDGVVGDRVAVSSHRRTSWRPVADTTAGRCRV
jgi:hypothetical protein